MHMVFLKPVLLAIFMVIILLSMNSARADGWFYFDPIELAVAIRFDGDRNTTEQSSLSAGDTTYKRETLLLEERLFARLSGYAIDPRISKISIQVEPVFRQGKETINDDKDRASGNDLDYSLNLGVLQGSTSAFDLNMGTFRRTSVNDLAFGSRNKSDIKEHELIFNWKNSWFPLNFNYKTGSFKQSFGRLDGLISKRDEDRQRIRLTGRSNKLRITLDSERVDDNVFGRDYEINRALIHHTLQWGQGSDLFSNIRAFDRQGFNGYRQLFWDETASIHHTDSLSSRTSYLLVSQQALTKSTTHEVNFRLQHSLYDNLRSSAFLRGRSTNSESLSRTVFDIGARTNYKKTFNFGFVSAGLYGDYMLTDRVSESGNAEVINEKHQAKLVEPIILKQQLIIEPTIIVTADDGFVYAEGIDYEALAFGGVFTEIRIIPSGRISVEDLLLVSYIYELFPSAEYTSLSTGYSFSYTYRWIRLFHNGYKRDHRLRSGYGVPADQKNQNTGVELSWNLDAASVRLRAESRFWQHGDFENDVIFLGQSLGFNLSNQFSLNFSGTQVFTDSSGVVTLDPLMDADSQLTESSGDYYAFDATLTWMVRPDLVVAPSMGAWKRKEETSAQTSRDVNRLYYSANLRISWQLRKLALDFIYNYNASDIDGRDRTGNRIYFSARRQFR